MTLVRAKHADNAQIAVAILSFAKNMGLSTPFMTAATLSETLAILPAATAAALLGVATTRAAGRLPAPSRWDSGVPTTLRHRMVRRRRRRRPKGRPAAFSR